MNNSKYLPWLFVAVGGWGLVSGLLFNDMSGIAALGANPDMPVSFGLSPGRFLLGFIINGALTGGGVWMLMKGVRPKA
jgi:hypothetical protein